MKNSPFSDIKKKGKKPDLDEFIDDAKVDGAVHQLDKNERRGSSYIDKETGKKVKLTGKILQVPVNGYELKELEKGAQKMGLPLGSYLRTLGLEAAEKY
ncbi:hypothetical protein ACPF37_003470 [Vibrio cholerae]|jgi:hypothetical protein|uniref:hypothetical protein n=1 Tax=Vibrio TaxID=662 RepID=UPI00056E4656|nr:MULTISPECIES: hypothetical protein [Vibrio]EKO3967065.1 hypothetical protein [Vibrio fluvialis]EGQ9414862.1 hypothetical protein [Vibrio cholerae]EGR0261264.1 hypothetical protein [Vibrio cholerae]EGR1913085.1 hypothetical protein [Vibrio cholerae]EGR2014513.1 hypothetical protein [Vibrio cholerae]